MGPITDLATEIQALFGPPVEGDTVIFQLERRPTPRQIRLLQERGLMNGHPRLLHVPATASANVVNGTGLHFWVEQDDWTIHVPITQEPKTASYIEIKEEGQTIRFGRIKKVRSHTELEALRTLAS